MSDSTGLREISASIWREIIPYIVSRNMKGCILDTNLKEQGR